MAVSNGCHFHENCYTNRVKTSFSYLIVGLAREEIISMEIVQLNVLTHEEIIEKVVSASLDLEELREILIDTEFMSKTIDEAFEELITLLKEVVEDVEGDRKKQRQRK